LLINVKCYGIYGSVLGDSLVVELRDRDGIVELLEFLEQKIFQSEPEAPQLIDRGKPLVKLLINNVVANHNTPLQDGDNLTLLPVIGGG
jgi:molybdopterin converting factor small subunit